MAKAVLEKPMILLVDQLALDFSDEELPDMMVKINALFPHSTILLCLSTFENILEFENCVVMESGILLEHDKVETLILNKASNLNHLIINSDPQDFIDLYAKSGGKEPEKTTMEQMQAEEKALELEEERLMKEEAEIERQEQELQRRHEELEEEMQRKAKELEECFQNSKTDLPTFQGYEYTKMDLGKKVK
jgi:ABC-type methionine transport system ATPase subunit